MWFSRAKEEKENERGRLLSKWKLKFSSTYEICSSGLKNKLKNNRGKGWGMGDIYNTSNNKKYVVREGGGRL